MTYSQAFNTNPLFELARSGNFQAISEWINQELIPQGIYARVNRENTGSLQVLVEFQQEPPAENLIKFICHQLWQLNSPVVEGVKILGRFYGSPHILWKQSVKIVTPARRQKRQREKSWIRFQTFRALLLMGSTLAAFIMGCWVSYHEVLVRNVSNQNSHHQAMLISSPPPKRTDQVQAALEKVNISRHKQVNYPQDPTITLMFGGDVNMSHHFAQVNGQNHQLPFANFPEYRDADLAMVNLENPLTKSQAIQPGEKMNFKADPSYVNVLTEGGIDIVNLANDQTMNYGKEGFQETLDTLNKSGILPVGAGRNAQEARQPRIVEVKGKRIAYLGYADSDLDVAKENSAGINGRQNDQIAADIRAIRDQVDWVVVNFHWGVELANYPGDWQIDLARFTIDQGADLVVGHHPHVLQGAEIYQGRPIIYSLGNFIFGGNPRSEYDTATLKVSLKRDRMKVEFLPVEVKNYQAQVAKGEKGQAILKHIAEISTIFDQPMKSPVVLDVRKNAIVPAPTSTPILEVQAPTASPTTVSNSADVPPILNPSVQKDIELTPPITATEPITPGLTNQPVVEGVNVNSVDNPGNPMPSKIESDPFIKEPFIKDPFIELPSVQIQSFRPPITNQTVSFQVKKTGPSTRQGISLVQLPTLC